MGNANSSGASKKKGVLGGLFRRNSGNRTEDEETTPTTGVSLRNRFSALEPVAVPTDGMPKKVSENVSEPDPADDVKVIHTSTARSIRFSDRIGMAVPSETEDNYERKISFKDDEEEEEECSSCAGEIDEDSIGRYGTAFECKEDVEDDVEADVPEVSEIADIEEDTLTESVSEEDDHEFSENEDIEADVEIIAETDEQAEADAAAVMRANLVTETNCDNIPETTVIGSRTFTKPDEGANARSFDDFDGGYDFLPRRTVSNRFEAMNRRTETPVRSAEITIKDESVNAVPQPETVRPAAEKKCTSLAERMRARHSDTEYTKQQEIQSDAPVQHESASRTSLLDKVTKEGPSGRRVSEVIRGSEKKEETQAVIPEITEEHAAETIEYEPETIQRISYTEIEEAVTECIVDTEEADEIIADAEVIVEAETETITEIEAEIEVESDAEAEADIEVGAEIEAEVEVEAESEAEIDIEIEAEIEADIEVESEAEAEADIEVEVETIAEIEIGSEAETEVEAEVEVEAGSEAMTEAYVTDEIEVETEVPDVEIPCAEEVSEQTVAEDDGIYDPMMEIENDLPVSEETEDESRIDDAEREILLLSEGVIVDNGVVTAAVVPIYETIECEEAAAEVPEAICEVQIREEMPEEMSEAICEVQDIEAEVQEIEAEDIEAEIQEETSDVPIGAFSMCFSFISEENASPSASVNFVWGK